ncbi:MAG: YqaE/Pmp3 family membrane protein [Leptolyngbyaceae cyanobacterium MAG.088]|nr:YqaE/Pmp3 family membrane protein [Leptolyngbyaceae cyanobacterium MAG.088]
MSKPLRYLLAILLPPVGVFLTYGVSTSLVISIILTLLGWLPGSLYAVWALAKHDENVGEAT